MTLTSGFTFLSAFSTVTTILSKHAPHLKAVAANKHGDALLESGLGRNFACLEFFHSCLVLCFDLIVLGIHCVLRFKGHGIEMTTPRTVQDLYLGRVELVMVL